MQHALATPTNPKAMAPAALEAHKALNCATDPSVTPKSRHEKKSPTEVGLSIIINNNQGE
jgi:hypothetical protein